MRPRAYHMCQYLPNKTAGQTACRDP